MKGLVEKIKRDKFEKNDVNERLNDSLLWLSNYYKSFVFSIIGLNDLKSISYINPYTQKSILAVIRDYFKDYNINATVVDVFNLVINSPEHIDYMLSHNMNLKDIKTMNYVSYYSKFEKGISPFDVSYGLDVFDYIYRLREKLYKTDNQCGIRDVLKYSYEPLVIYTSGYSHLFRIIHEKYFKSNSSKYNFDYDSIYKDKILDYVMDKVKMNIEHILSINPHANIMVLGSNMNSSNYDYYRLIVKYNNYLKQICSNYHISYIDTNSVFDYSNKIDGLILLILEELCRVKKDMSICDKKPIHNMFLEDNLGIRGVVHDVNRDYNKAFYTYNNLGNYNREKHVDKISQLYDEKRVLERVLRRG